MKNKQRRMKNTERKTQRKETILDAFEVLVARYGVDKTTMQEIATLVGISVGTLYNEFADKEALIDALMDRVEMSVNRQIQAIEFSTDAPDEQLAELMRTLTRVIENIVQNNRSLTDYILSGSQSFRYVGKKIHQDSRGQQVTKDKIRSIIETGVEQGIFKTENVPATVAAITQGLTTCLVARVMMDQKEDRATRKNWDIWFDLLIKGLKK
jgi:AcrR family transcriptional regulator